MSAVHRVESLQANMRRVWESGWETKGTKKKKASGEFIADTREGGGEMGGGK